MTLRLTPERVAATYECLCAFPPFSRMALPAPPQIEFRISRAIGHDALYTRYARTDRPILEVSERRVGYFDTLALCVAHEMIHLYQDKANTETPGVQHNAEFVRIAKRVCRAFGWDPRQFL